MVNARCSRAFGLQGPHRYHHFMQQKRGRENPNRVNIDQPTTSWQPQSLVLFILKFKSWSIDHLCVEVIKIISKGSTWMRMCWQYIPFKDQHVPPPKKCIVGNRSRSPSKVPVGLAPFSVNLPVSGKCSGQLGSKFNSRWCEFEERSESSPTERTQMNIMKSRWLKPWPNLIPDRWRSPTFERFT